MGVDDDADCAEHVFVLTEVHADQTGARLLHTCKRCGAVAYEASRSDRPAEPTGTGT